MTKKLNVLSLCDGISCGQVAFERAGIEINKYYASEIDNKAIKVTQFNYPNTIQLGDIRKISYKGNVLIANDKEYNTQIDIVIGGTPCQNFSVCGDQKGFDGDRSNIIYHYFRLLDEIKPKYFLLENVIMKNVYKNKITEILGIEPIMINSALVSAQSRKRLYWTNIPNVTQPDDKHISMIDLVNKYGESKMLQNTEPEGNLTLIKEVKNTKLDYLDRIGYTGSKFNQQTTVININGKSHTLTTYRGYEGRILYNNKLYKPTVLMTELLQTLPMNYTLKASEFGGRTSRTPLIGNGWTVDVIAHIFKGLKEQEND